MTEELIRCGRCGAELVWVEISEERWHDVAVTIECSGGERPEHRVKIAVPDGQIYEARHAHGAPMARWGGRLVEIK